MALKKYRRKTTLCRQVDTEQHVETHFSVCLPFSHKVVSLSINMCWTVLAKYVCSQKPKHTPLLSARRFIVFADHYMCCVCVVSLLQTSSDSTSAQPLLDEKCKYFVFTSLQYQYKQEAGSLSPFMEPPVSIHWSVFVCKGAVGGRDIILNDRLLTFPCDLRSQQRRQIT